MKKYLCKNKSGYDEYKILPGKYYDVTIRLNMATVYLDDYYLQLFSMEEDDFKYFYDYFYTDVEMRKMKLQKLKTYEM
jgi:hypothetical protein